MKSSAMNILPAFAATCQQQHPPPPGVQKNLKIKILYLLLNLVHKLVQQLRAT